MAPERLFRLSGVALLLGSPLTTIAVVLGDSINDRNNPLTMPLNVLSVIGSMLVLIGLPGLYARQATRAGWLGLIGFILLFFAGLAMGVGGGTLNTFHPAFQESQPLTLSLSLLFSLAAILFGISTMVAGVPSRWAGLLLILAGCGTALENVVTVSPLDVIVTDVSGAVFMLGIAWFGIALIAQPGTEVAQPPIATSQ